MDDLDSRVEQNRKLLCEVADVLKGRGYGIAETLSGQKVEEPQPSYSGRYDSMGILVRAKPRILGIIPVPFVKRWAYSADLWIDNKVRGATPEDCWVLDVYGSENVDNARKLMQQIAKPYGVEVIAKVSFDELRWAGQELYLPELGSQAR